MTARTFEIVILLLTGLLAPVSGSRFLPVLQVDEPGVTVSPTSGLVTDESGLAADFSIVLDAEPVADVTIHLASSHPLEGVPDLASVTFTLETWFTPQNVTVTGLPDDVDDGDQLYSIVTTLESTDPAYSAIEPDDVSLTNVDLDTAGVTVSTPDPQSTTESGGMTSFTVTLNSRPSSPVTVFAQSSDPAEAAVSPSEVTLQPGDWQTAASFTVTGADDDVDDGNQDYTIQLTLDSSDPLYDAIDPADVSLTNLDDDTAGITVTAPTLLVTGESGSTALFSLALTSRPTAIVTLQAQSSDLSEGTVEPAEVNILPGQWQDPVDFTVTGVQDLLLDGDQDYTIELGVTSADPLYAAAILNDLPARNLDDDQDTPVDALPDSYFTAEDTDLVVGAPGLLANDSGPGTLSVVIPLEQNPSSGTLSINPDGSFTYSPNDNFNGADQFTYRATNGVQTSNAVTVTLDVTPVNDPPAAVADTYLTNAVNPGALVVPARGVLANDTDIDSSTLTAELVTQPTSGTLTLNTDGSFRFVPALGQVQNSVTFTYHAFDGEAYSANQTVTINIDAVPPAKPVWAKPVGNNGTYYIITGSFTLGVTTDPSTVRVEFFRWNAVENKYEYDLGVDTTAPYEVTVQADILNIGLNEMFAWAFDEAGNRSERASQLWISRGILMDKIVYLPVLTRE